MRLPLSKCVSFCLLHPALFFLSVCYSIFYRVQGTEAPLQLNLCCVISRNQRKDVQVDSCEPTCAFIPTSVYHPLLYFITSRKRRAIIGRCLIAPLWLCIICPATRRNYISTLSSTFSDNVNSTNRDNQLCARAANNYSKGLIKSWISPSLASCYLITHPLTRL